MVLQELEDRLYTSTEVANILGVSLRSVYRYLEDSKLKAEMKTATGRHRFTKQNIVDFMSPQVGGSPAAAPAKAVEPAVKAPVEPVAVTPEPAPTPPVTEVAETPTPPAQPAASGEAEEVDWLSKFRQAAEKYKTDQDTEAEVPAEKPAAESVSGLADAPAPVAETTSVESSSPTNYYKSAAGGLKDIAQSIDKSAKKASLDYAFTMDAGLSLHKPISPFSLIHAYVKSEDLAFFEKILDLTSAEVGDAQLCLIVDDDASVYSGKTEVHGLNVVSNDRLRADLLAAGKSDLAGELS